MVDRHHLSSATDKEVRSDGRLGWTMLAVSVRLDISHAVVWIGWLMGWSGRGRAKLVFLRL